MPYKSEKISIAGTMYDRRRKLTEDQIKAIKLLYEMDSFSQRKLAEMFGCSRRLIQNILHPQKRSPAKKRPTAYWTEAKKKFREYKQSLYKNGKIKPNKHGRISEN